MNPSAEELPLCGVWVDGTGHAHVALETVDGGRAEAITGFRPFAWLTAEPAAPVGGVEVERLDGPGEFRFIAHAAGSSAFASLSRKSGDSFSMDTIRPFESQFLLQKRRRMFDEVPFQRLRRCQLDIETAAAGADHFSDPENPDDRVLAIGLSFGGRDTILAIEEDTDEGESKLLGALNAALLEEDPDTIEGHNLFKFDLDYLRVRAKRLKVPCAWGRFGQKAVWRRSRLRVAERWIDFPRCDVPGRSIVDTYLLVQLYDISVREMSSYGLKDSAVYFGVTSEDDDRTYIPGAEIQNVFRADRARFDAYLADDLRETRGIADLLLPTYYEQAKAFPTTLQEITLRGSAGKLDLLFLEKYYHAKAACPVPGPIGGFEGGFTRSFKEGVFRHVLHFDVASLYPSLLLGMKRNPRNDSLGIFIPLLRELRDYRLKFKALARTAETAELRAEYQARQTSFKILINSFYGYLGFSGARFSDGDLASEVTRRGRELLKGLIADFEANGCEILEADTDGIYLSSEKWHPQPEALLERVARMLPPGIDLEFDGTYVSMFCYKAKNYALYDGERVTIRGSALRSRGIEPYLRRLTTALVHNLLGAGGETPAQLVEHYRKAIEARTLPVKELAKSENLGQSPESYRSFVEGGGKPRRAAPEAALQMRNPPRMGERVSYYILPKRPKEGADWQRARPLELFDPETAPYDPNYYLDKLNDWLERYGPFISVRPTGMQEELGL